MSKRKTVKGNVLIGSDELINREFVKKSLRSALHSLLGDASLSALEFHLFNFLGNDPYDVFCDEPPKFYEALKTIFGLGADKVLEIMALTMIQKGALTVINAEEFLKLVKRGDEESRLKLLKLFRHGGASPI